MKDRLRSACAYKDAEELLSNPKVDFVLIAVQDRFHVPLARQALATGKHVLVEKPLGITVGECEQLRTLIPA